MTDGIDVDVGYRHARLSDYLGPCWWGRPYRYDHTDRFPEFLMQRRCQTKDGDR